MTLPEFLAAQRDLLRAAGVKVTGRKLLEVARATGYTFDNNEFWTVVRAWGTNPSKAASTGGTQIGDTPMKNALPERRRAKIPHEQSASEQKTALTCAGVARGLEANISNPGSLGRDSGETHSPVAIQSPVSSFANAQLPAQVETLFPVPQPERRNRKLPGLTVPPPPENVAGGQVLTAIWARLRPENRPVGMTLTSWRGANIRAAKDMLAAGLTQAQILAGFERFEAEHHGQQIYSLARLQKEIAFQHASDRNRGVDTDREFGHSLYNDAELEAML